jgi:hypothetical protein
MISRTTLENDYEEIDMMVLTRKEAPYTPIQILDIMDDVLNTYGNDIILVPAVYPDYCMKLYRLKSVDRARSES